MVAIVTVKAIVSAKPHKTVPILNDAKYAALRQTIIGTDMGKFNFLLGTRKKCT